VAGELQADPEDDDPTVVGGECVGLAVSGEVESNNGKQS